MAETTPFPGEIASPRTETPKTNEATGAAANIDAAARKRIGDYFDEKYDKKVDRLRALRLSTRRRKWALGIVGAILLLGSLAGFVAGKLSYPMFLEREPFELIFGLIGLTILCAALILRSVEELPNPEQVEREIDAATRRDVDFLQANAGKLLGLSDGASAAFDVMLVGFPDKAVCKALGVPMGARIGADKRPRTTPATVTAMKLSPSTLAVYEGTVCLITGDPASERLIEVAYRDILMLERSSLARPHAEEVKEKKKNILKKVVTSRLRHYKHEKDVLAIHFANRRSVQIVLRDSRFAEPLKAGEHWLSASPGEVQEFWNALRTRWYAAQREAT